MTKKPTEAKPVQQEQPKSEVAPGSHAEQPGNKAKPGSNAENQK